MKEIDKNRIEDLLRIMLEQEDSMTIILVGLISADSNRTEEEIQENSALLHKLQEGAEAMTPTKENAERLQQIKDIIAVGIAALENDLHQMSQEELMFDILGNKMYKLRNLYHSYFNKDVVEHDCRDKYIYDKFGECKEPVYDPLWKVWYLGHRNQNGDLYYSVGCAQDILGEYLHCPVRGDISWYTDDCEEPSVCTSGSVDFLIGEIWRNKKENVQIRFDDDSVLSKQQRRLVDRICESRKLSN